MVYRLLRSIGPRRSSAQGEAGGQAFADRFPHGLEALADGHDDLQALLADPARVSGASHREHRVGVPYLDLHQLTGDPQVQQNRSCGVLLTSSLTTSCVTHRLTLSSELRS